MPSSHLPTLPTDTQTENVRDQLRRVLVSLVFRNNPPERIAELPLSQLRCLHVVTETEGQKMHEVADRLEVKLPAASHIVDRLVKRGYVERRSDPSDRRVVRLYPTELARDVEAEAAEARAARLAATIARIRAEDLPRVIDGLCLLAAAAEAVVEAEREQVAAPGPAPDPVLELISRRARVRPVEPMSP